jgi:alanyl-tRNA synthetase
MTHRLYYLNPYCARFSARVEERLTWEGHPAVVLNSSVFYPTAGGQPADRGTLEGVPVVDVVVREADDAVVHVLERPLEGNVVEGVIDWQRRFDHMQQHTGQHILSAAFERLLGAETVGFHLGSEASTIDVDVPRLAQARVAPVEALANQVIWENRPVTVRFAEPEEMAELPLRKPPTVEGPIRLVEVEDLDLNPCGGTHVDHTGEIGMIKVVNLEYRGDETRVEFLCGGRALRDYRAKNEMIHTLAAQLTVGYWELDQAVERLQADYKEMRREMRQAREALVEVEASRLAESAERRPEYRLVRRLLDPREPGELRHLAQALMQHPGVVALLATIYEGRTHLCFSRAEDVALNVAELLQQACRELDGKGGGQPHLAQGSGAVTQPERVRAVLETLASSLTVHTVEEG